MPALFALSEPKCVKKLSAVAGKKKALNVGRSGGSAGLEDYQFDDTIDGEDDFM